MTASSSASSTTPTPARGGLVPRLRFPGFKGEWKLSSLQNFCEFNPASGHLPKNFVYIDLEAVDRGCLKSRNVILREEAPSRAQRLLRVGDIIFQTVRPYQRNNFHLKTTDSITYVASTGYAHLRAYDSPEFLFQIIHTDIFVDRVIEKCTGSSYPAISSQALGRIQLPVPTLLEQQKIAYCLSSLDELITAESEKLETLKEHKKGLMQELFPQEGETVPRIRFPEFEGSGEWEVKPFSSVVARSFYGTSKPTSTSGQYPVLRMGNMSEGSLDIRNLVYVDLHENEFEKLRHEKGDILLNRTNSIDLVGKISLFDLDEDYISASYIVTYRLNRKAAHPAYCNALLNTERFQSRIRDMASRAVSQANINPTQFRNRLHIPLPSLDEQQKIASILSSLDDRITVQAERIETLKEHKKGLMQQLFPVMEG